MIKIALRVTTWGDGLAVRLPDDYANRTGIRDGDAIEVAVLSTVDERPGLKRPFDRADFVLRIKRANEGMPIGKSVIDEVRGDRF